MLRGMMCTEILKILVRNYNTKGIHDMGDIILGSSIALIVIAIISWMVRNVKQGKSFCGADYGDLTKTQKKDIK